MLKKTIFALLLVTASNATFASALYVGVGVGIGAANFSQHARVINPDTNVIDNNNLSGTGPFSTVYAGYGWTCNPFYLAGEFNLNTSGLDHNSANIELIHHTVSHTSYQMRTSWGASILPGFLFSDTSLIYARFGYTSGHFKVITTDSSLAHASKMLDGLRIGVGISKMFYKQFTIRLEYSQIRYDDKTLFAHPGLTRKTTTITPTINQFELGVDYRFRC